jgi:hypothetical protein
MSFSHSPRIVTSGLVLALDAADQNSYPGSGTTWADMSGNGYTGSLINGPTYSTGSGGTIVFDGVNDQAITNYNASGLQTFTAIAWIKTTNTTGYNFVFSAGSFNSPTIAGFGLVINGTTFYFDHCSVTNVTSYSVPTIYDGVWRQVGIYRDASNNAGIIINGSLVASVSYATSFTNSNFAIGSRPGGVTYNPFFGGSISNSQLYNRALSSSEIQQNYNALKSRFGL